MTITYKFNKKHMQLYKYKNLQLKIMNNNSNYNLEVLQIRTRILLWEK